MRIVSTFVPCAIQGLLEGRRAQLTVFDTFVDAKRLVVGITVGDVGHGQSLEDVELSAVGQKMVKVLADHVYRNFPDAPFLVVGIGARLSAPKRVRQALKKAPENAGMLLVCANAKVYDAAFAALNVDFETAYPNPH